MGAATGPFMNPYQILGASADCDVETLRAFYRRLVRAHHPDRAPDEAARVQASARMVQINWAWHIVSDPARRAAYDARARLDQIEAAQRTVEQRQRQARAAAHSNAPRSPAPNGASERGPNGRGETLEEQARRRQILEQQALERAARAQQMREYEARKRESRARQNGADKQSRREAKQRAAQTRARVRQMRREDKERAAMPSARRQLAEAARLFGQEGRAADAIAICQNVLRVDGRNVPARELLGDFYLRLGREDRALPLWEQALMLQPDNAALRRKFNALQPHQPRPYAPHPPMPRAATSPTARATTSPRSAPQAPTSRAAAPQTSRAATPQTAAPQASNPRASASNSNSNFNGARAGRAAPSATPLSAPRVSLWGRLRARLGG